MEIDLFSILLLILMGRVFGLVVSRIGFQPIIGEVLGGVLLGALVVGGLLFVNQDAMTAFADLGIILIMLLAGLITDFNKFAQNRKASTMVGGLGVLVSFALVFFPLISLKLRVFHEPYDQALVSSLFISVILSNTAIEVSAKLFSRGAASGRLHSVVMGASLVDDIIAVFLIGMVSSIALLGGPPSILEMARLSVLVALFLLLSFLICTRLVERLFNHLVARRDGDEMVLLTATILLALLFAILARQFGLHEVIGAYIAGLIIGKWGSKIGPLLKRRLAWLRLVKEIDPPLRAIFGPLFFGYIGLTFAYIILDTGITGQIVLLAALLLSLAILGKVVGCGLGAIASRVKGREAFVIGVAMCGRGALELVLLRYGLTVGAITEVDFIALVLVTLGTILLTPILYVKARERSVHQEELEAKA